MAEDVKKEGEQKAEEQKAEEQKVEQKGGGPGPEGEKSKPVAEQKEEELFEYQKGNCSRDQKRNR